MNSNSRLLFWSNISLWSNFNLKNDEWRVFWRTRFNWDYLMKDWIFILFSPFSLFLLLLVCFKDFANRKMEVLHNWFLMNDMSDRHKLQLQHTCTFVYFRQLLHHSISALLSLFASFRDYILGEMTFWMGIPSQRSVDTRIWTRRKYGNNAVTNGKSKCHKMIHYKPGWNTNKNCTGFEGKR